MLHKFPIFHFRNSAAEITGLLRSLFTIQTCIGLVRKKWRHWHTALVGPRKTAGASNARAAARRVAARQHGAGRSAADRAGTGRACTCMAPRQRSPWRLRENFFGRCKASAGATNCHRSRRQPAGPTVRPLERPYIAAHACPTTATADHACTLRRP